MFSATSLTSVCLADPPTAEIDVAIVDGANVEEDA